MLISQKQICLRRIDFLYLTGLQKNCSKSNTFYYGNVCATMQDSLHSYQACVWISHQSSFLVKIKLQVDFSNTKYSKDRTIQKSFTAPSIPHDLFIFESHGCFTVYIVLLNASFTSKMHENFPQVVMWFDNSFSVEHIPLSRRARGYSLTCRETF